LVIAPRYTWTRIPPLHGIHEIPEGGGRVVDDLIGPELKRSLHVPGRGGGGDVGATGPGELNGEASNATGATVDEHPLPS
jgi:hypothetical protein